MRAGDAGHGPGEGARELMQPEELASRIDQTLLRPTATPVEVTALCRGALHYGFAAVCVAPAYVPLAARELQGSPVRVCTVVGFPLGNTTSAVKVYEAREAVKAGASEIDMVINVGLLRARVVDGVRQDIRAVVEAVNPPEGSSAPAGASGEAGADRSSRGGRGLVTVKVIIETCYLTDEEKMLACRLAEEAGAHFVKTSTGFGPAGATAEDIRLMRRTVGDRLGVKAAGGIRTLSAALALLEAGADRLGTSSGEALMVELAALG